MAAQHYFASFLRQTSINIPGDLGVLSLLKSTEMTAKGYIITTHVTNYKMPQNAHFGWWSGLVTACVLAFHFANVICHVIKEYSNDIPSHFY